MVEKSAKVESNKSLTSGASSKRVIKIPRRKKASNGSRRDCETPYSNLGKKLSGEMLSYFSN